MKSVKKQTAKGAGTEISYAEISVKLPLLALLLALFVTGGPLAWGLFRVNKQGAASVQVDKYRLLAESVVQNVGMVRNLLKDRQTDYHRINEVVPLVVPEVVIVEAEKPEVKGPKPLEVEIHGIYYNREMPLVDLDGQTYRIGDSVQGYRITKIDETSVHFVGPDNQVVVKDMYENLFNGGK